MTAADVVERALAALPRESFLPPRQVGRAGYDGPLPIGHGQTNSQPRTVRRMLELLGARQGDRVLDLGSGSAWTTALLAWIVGPTGSVLGVERVPDLVATGAANLARAGMPWARIRAASPGVLGAPEQGPFERILVSAAPAQLPAEVVGQLAPGGVLVIPVAGRLLRVTDGPGGPLTEDFGGYRFVPLVTDPPPGQPA